MDIEIVVRLVALLLAALMTGALMVNWIGLARAMSQMSSAAAYTEFHQATNRTFDPYMPSIGFGAIVGGIALAAFFFRRAFSVRLVGDRYNHLLCARNRDQPFDQCADQ